MSSGRKLVAAAALLVVGAVATYNLFLPREQRVGPGWSIGAFVLVGPVLLTSGAVVLLLELVPRRDPGRAHKVTATRPPRWVLVAGLAMLLVGGFPWAYTPLFFGSQNEEAWGMIGTIIFLLVGLPGLAVTGITVSRMLFCHQKTAKRVQTDGP